MKKRLTEKEEELMQFFWDNGPLFVREIVGMYPEPRPHFNTVSTFVRMLEGKGFVGHETVGNSNRYHAVVSREDYSGMTLRGVVDRYFGSSLTGVVSTLFKQEKLSDEEVTDLISRVLAARNKNENK
ncbi:MAG: BlaI/MecI/CopY family transcriptional regulator [Duncaniella sp.]|nr:BlaI/MecI/CopY family transcriptional regulator [Duncaniella sp.]HBI58832.1 transcriptional regulator [Porphyromonadaceae bacterium]